MTIAYVVLAALAYLIVDIYPQVKSFRAIVSNTSFWVLVVVYSILNLLAFWLFSSSSMGQKIQGANIQGAVSPAVSRAFGMLLLILLSTLGTISILQSFVLKLGDLKFVDVGSQIEKFKSVVLESSAKRDASWNRKRVFRATTQLAQKYQGDAKTLKMVYYRVFANRRDDQIDKELKELQQHADEMEVPCEELLAGRIAAADIELAEDVLRDVAMPKADTVSGK